jgi:hypothetical protein
MLMHETCRPTETKKMFFETYETFASYYAEFLKCLGTQNKTC